MKHSKRMIGSCMVAAAMVSMNLAAATRTDGWHACAGAAVTAMEMERDVAMDYSLSTDTRKSSAKLGRNEMFHLDIRNPKNDEVISRFDCTVDRNGTVRDLQVVPVNGEDAIVRAES